MISTEELKRLKDQNLKAEDEVIETLDQYYAAVAGGATITTRFYNRSN